MAKLVRCKDSLFYKGILEQGIISLNKYDKVKRKLCKKQLKIFSAFPCNLWKLMFWQWWGYDLNITIESGLYGQRKAENCLSALCYIPIVVPGVSLAESFNTWMWVPGEKAFYVIRWQGFLMLIWVGKHVVKLQGVKPRGNQKDCVLFWLHRGEDSKTPSKGG